MPIFMSYSDDKYTVNPTDPTTDLGIFEVKGYLDDSRLRTDFFFTVTVVNDPPYFS